MYKEYASKQFVEEYLNLNKSDWNQNDETQADYIKNRTHYDYIEKDYILQDRVLSYESSSTYTKVENIEHNLEPDKIYTVIIDGIKYENLEVQGNDPWKYIGHSSSYDFTDAVYPFKIANDHYELKFSYNGGGEHTVSLFVETEAIHYLDPKYIKDMYYTDNSLEILVNEQTVSGFEEIEINNYSVEDSSAIYIVENPFEFVPVKGNTYKIIWDGTTYEYKCGSENGILYIGNVQSGGDIPFAIIYADKLYLITESTAESHTISIFINEHIHHLDPKYIKDMYYEKIINRTFIDNIEYTGYEGYIPTDIKATLILGETYTVVWNGTEYSNLICFDDYGYPTIGDAYDDLGTNYPFMISTYDGFIEMIYNDEDVTHTISISGPIIELTKIDEKYLPFTEDDMYNIASSRVSTHNNSTVSHKSLFNKKQDVLTFDTVPTEGSTNPVTSNGIFMYFNSANTVKDYLRMKDVENGYEYIVEIRGGKLTSRLPCIELTVTALPNKLVYYDGDKIDMTGAIISSICVDGSTYPVQNYSYTTLANIDNQVIEISYTDGGVVYTTSIAITVSEFDPTIVLIDFTYTDNGDGTYTITGWKETLNGVASTEMIVPASSHIII